MRGRVLVGVLVGVAVLGAVGLAVASQKQLPPPGSFDVRGDSGTAYRVVFVKEFPTPTGGKQTFWDVFIGSDRIFRYSQNDDDKTSRVLIVTPLHPTDSRLVAGLSDFGAKAAF